MASTSGLKDAISDKEEDPSNILTRSSFQKTVCLEDWWLVKAEDESHGRRLAVAGFVSRGQRAVRMFVSAPILQTYDVFTLKTVDDITVVLQGFLNKPRTLGNGFPSEVSNHFVFGFPPYWEEYSNGFLGKESSPESISIFNLDEKSSLPPERNPENDEGILVEFEEDQIRHFEAEDNSEGERRVIADNLENGETSSVQKSEVLVLQHGGDTPVVCSSTATAVGPGGFGKESSSMEYILGNVKTPKQPLSPGKRTECDIKPEGSINESNVRARRKSVKTVSKMKLLGEVRNSEGGVVTRSLRKLKMKESNSQLSASNSVPVPVGISDGLEGSLDNADNDSGGGVSSTDKNSRRDQPCGSLEIKESREENDKRVFSSSKRFSSMDKKDEIGTSNEKNRSVVACSTSTKARKKLAYGSPASPNGKQNASPVSLASVSVNRSRSGRLLLPTMEFWRNQIPVYGADRTILEIKDGFCMELPKRGSRSDPQRKRRRHI